MHTPAAAPPPLFIKWLYVISVGSATLAVLIYLLLFAAPTYRTEATLIVRENRDQGGPSLTGLSAEMLGGAVRGSLEDAYILAGYLKSPGLIESADEALELRAHYSAPTRDLIRRLPMKAPAEDFHEFFRKRVKVTVVPESSMLTVQVNAFDPNFTTGLANYLIAQSETAINDLNARMAASQTNLADQELENARVRLAAVRQELFEFRTANELIDPESEIGFRLGNLSQLDARLLTKQSELRAKQQFLREDALELRSLRQEVSALEEQRTAETRRLVASGDHSLADAMKTFEALKLESEFATHAYTAAFAAAENAKMESIRQEKFILTVASPHLPEKPAFPRPFLGTLIAFIVFSLIYSIGKLTVATIRDHTL